MAPSATNGVVNGAHVNGAQVKGAGADDSNAPSSVDVAERDGVMVPKHDENGYYIREQAMGTKRRVKVVLMGAGASTLNFLKKAEEELTNVDIVVYEKNSDVGGTWLENNYPGCACDIPSINYQFSWKIKLWTHYYSYAKEIFEYLKEIEQENDFISKYIKVRHRVDKAEWDEAKGVWSFKVRNLETDESFDDEAEFFINGGGVLNKWKMPDIEGIDDFKGEKLHTAWFPQDGYAGLKGKRVAVLGAGSSGVQCVAKIQKDVQHLYHWIRSPIWITAGFAQTWAGSDGANFAYTEEQHRYLAENPKKYLEYRKAVEDELNQRFKFIIKGSDAANQARVFSEDQMRRKMNFDKRLCDKIIPTDFNPGCRRPTPAPGYLEALVAPNATIFTDSIKKLTPNGFMDQEGNEHEIDVLICATGFDTSWLPRFPFIAHGKDLREIWKEENGGVTSYLAIGIPGFPNHFSFCGPYGPLGHGSFMPLIERWTQYMFDAISKVQMENIKSVTPKWKPARDFRRHADHFLKRTAWTSPCRSWFKNGKIDGQATMYPGSRVHYLELMSQPRWEDYDVEYWDETCMFSWLGNGFHIREEDGRDITFYLGSLREDGLDVEPEFDDQLIHKLAGWAVGA